MYDLDNLAVLWKLTISATLSILNEDTSPMAHFWIPDPPTSSDGTRRGWAVMPISTNPVDLAAVLSRASAMAPALAPASCLLFSLELFGSERWVMVGPDSVSVCGLPLVNGIRVMADGDDIRFGDTLLWFSSERLARLDVFPGASDRAKCLRCFLRIPSAVHDHLHAFGPRGVCLGTPSSCKYT